MVTDIKNKIVKILAIDDDEFMRIFMKDVFLVHAHDEKPYEFNSAPNIKWAEEAMVKSKPDIILLDMSLPNEEGGKSTVENGFAFLEKIKKDPATKDIKVLVFSGYSDKEIKDKAAKLGASEFFVKGEYLPKDLLEAINKHR